MGLMGLEQSVTNKKCPVNSSEISVQRVHMEVFFKNQLRRAQNEGLVYRYTVLHAM